jgi:hypothetical protein
VIDLVFWSFVIALTPLAPSLIWELFSGLKDWIGRGVARAFADAEPWGSFRPVSFSQSSGCISVVGRRSGPRTA